MSGINAMDNTVIACVDGSSSTRAVCEYAAWIAGKLDVPLALLHVLEKNEQPAVSDLTGTIGIDSREQLTQDLVRIMASALARSMAFMAGRMMLCRRRFSTRVLASTMPLSVCKASSVNVCTANRLLKIAREGGQMTPADLAKFESQRRYATLVALAIEGMATVTDEIIDLHDRIIGKLFNAAKNKHQQQFQASGKAINDKVRMYGRIERTLFILDWLQSVELRRRVHAGLNKGEALDDTLLQYLSPLGWEHINLTGDYLWRSSAKVGAGKFRPLRPLPPA